jgi:pyridoxine 4-dehydrogenase
MTTINPPATLAGSYRVGDFDLNRIGYGAMLLAGPGVFGPPRDRAAAIEVLRTAVELGVNHIDTADAYGPYITNEIIREALFPYSDHLHIVTKVGVVRDEQGGWLPANSPQSLRDQVVGPRKRSSGQSRYRLGLLFTRHCHFAVANEAGD